jgi:hypothetical protein
MSEVKISIGVLQRVAEFLADLPDDQVEALADGRARLAYVPEGSDGPAPRKPPARTSRAKAPQEFVPSAATTELLDRFQSLTSREHAADDLKPLKRPQLVDIAKALSVPNASSLNVTQLRNEIVEATVGRRLDSIAIRGFDGPRP